MKNVKLAKNDIRVRRVSQGFRQTELARAAGISAVYLRDIESKYFRPSEVTRNRIARALGCTAAELFEEEDKK